MDEEVMETENVPETGASGLCACTSHQGSTAQETYTSPHSQQISMLEYNQQTHHYTQQALRELKASPDYKKHTMKCKRCSRNLITEFQTCHSPFQLWV
jgi:hypothetical protein